jgi:hypothetical protein
MALHDWDQARGLDLWHEFSRRSSKYDHAVLDEKWATFTAGSGLTIGTILHLAKEAGWAPSWKRIGSDPLGPVPRRNSSHAANGRPHVAAPDYKTFPADALPEPLGGYVRAVAKSIGCDPCYVALPLLVVLAAAIGNSRRLELKRGWSAPPILWGAIVGESGTCKTPAFKKVLRSVRERQRKALEENAKEMKKHEAEQAMWEKEMTAWKREKDSCGDPPEKPEPPQAERFIVSDTTVEALASILLATPRGVLLARDELAGWIGSFDRYAGNGRGGADAAHWLSMHNAEAIIVDRKTGDRRTIYVPQAAVCVVGGIQPTILKRALGHEHRESGLAARLLLAYPPRKPKRWTEDDIDPCEEAKLARLVDRLYELEPHVADGDVRPLLIRLTAEAHGLWAAYYDAHAVEQADLTGDLSAAWSKLEEYAARLALVIHCVRQATLPQGDGDTISGKVEENRGSVAVATVTALDADSMRDGIRLAEWFKHEARRVYAMLTESDVQREARQLVEWVERKGGKVTARELQRGPRHLRGTGAAEAALEELVKAGLGHWKLVPTTDRGGQPTRVFHLGGDGDRTKKETGEFCSSVARDMPPAGGCVTDSPVATRPRANGVAGDRTAKTPSKDPDPGVRDGDAAVADALPGRRRALV